MSDNSLVSRREFLGKTAATAAAFIIVPRHVLGGPGHTPPSEVLTQGIIGVGGMGKGHIGYGGAKCLAVCDVDEQHMKEALGRAGSDCKGYRDFREVLEREDIDVIHVPTPPHWHAYISIAAAEAGKDIWCEKPMTRYIAEGQHVIDAVQRNGRVFRINTGGRFGGHEKAIKKIVSNGLIGWPITVRVTRQQGYNWKVAEWSGRTNLQPQPVPPVLDYEMWQGPAPLKPYHPHRVHQSFRGYWDYDGGGLADMGQHYLDPVQYFMGKDQTSPVEAEAEAAWPPHPDAVGLWGRVELLYGDGCKIIMESGEWGEEETGDLAFVTGPKGKIYKNLTTDPPDLSKKAEAFPDPEPMISDFTVSIRTRKKFGLNEENANRSAILFHLANVAIRTGRRLHFDPESQRFVGDDEANRLADVPMRAPWFLPKRGA